MSRTYSAGLVLLGALSVAGLSEPLLTDGEHPPMSIAVVGAALGLVSLVLAVLAWRRPRPAPAIGLVVLRLLAASFAVPAFLAPGVPLLPQLLAGTSLSIAVLGSVLVLAGLRRRAVAA